MASTFELEMGGATQVTADETPPAPNQTVAETNRLAAYAASSTTAVPRTNTATPTSSSNETPATTVLSENNNNKTSTGNEYGIGIRQGNPLSNFASYTYQLSLYMVTPDALSEFNNSGRKNIFASNNKNTNEAGSSGAYLIAQSGGIENKNRAPGFNFDYYIDNLEIKAAISGLNAGSNGTTVNYDMAFTITEPYGFSFITNLKRAGVALGKYATAAGFKDQTNPTRQFFVLGIKFSGYDDQGQLIGSIPGVKNTNFERFYDIVIKDLKFTIDGRAVIYRIKAAPTSLQPGLGTKTGLIDRGATNLSGSTVKDILDDLVNKLNQDQKDDKNREYPNTYSIVYIDDAKDIATSSMVTPGDKDKIKWNMSKPKDIDQVTPELQLKAQPNSNERTIAFNSGTPIIQAITSIIKQSTYITDALKVVYASTEEPNAETDGPVTVDEKTEKKLKWFTINPLVSDIKYDTKISDWSYKITYQVRTYEIPNIKSVEADKSSEYYGAVKRYEYWYSGQNSEIIKYSQEFNNTYFVVSLNGAKEQIETDKVSGSSKTPIAIGKRTYTDRLGQLGVGNEAQNSIQTDLSDGSAYAQATLEILGDPDFLSDPIPPGENNKPYHPNDTVNYSFGKVFIEIKFLEAVDYNNNTGLMTINHDILFWDYPKTIKDKLKGAISYHLRNVEHYFKGGKFTQKLIMNINDFPNVKKDDSSESGEGRENTSPTNSSLTAALGTAALGELGINIDRPSNNPVVASSPNDDANGSTATPPQSQGREDVPNYVV